MGQVTWSPIAAGDIDDIAAYISQDSPEEAALFIVRLVAATDKLEEFPASGRMIPEFHDVNRREIIVEPYRIMYQVRNQDVLITGVVHGARRISPDE